MKRSAFAAISLVAVTISACSQDEPRELTSPDVAFSVERVAAQFCDGGYDKTITSEQRILFAGATLKEAQALWRTVTQTCSASNPAPARENMLAYVRFTIGATRSGLVLGSTDEQSIVNHWNPAFQYVGHATPEVPAAVLTSAGAARVVLDSEGTTEFGIPLKAAMTVRKQDGNDVEGGRLFTIRPDPAGCLAATNLVSRGPCFEFSVYPTPVASEISGLPYLVGICEHEEGTKPALGHRTGGGLQVLDPTAVPNGASYPSLQFCIGSQLPNPPQFGGFMGFLRSVASFPSRLLSVGTAYAAHGGLGGLEDDLSPFGAVERRIFSADFGDNAIGSTPPQNSATSPAIGVWDSVFASSPGSILVQTSLGTAPNALDRPVVLSQGGGACGTACGGLSLFGEVKTSGESGAFASTGVYEVRWSSLQSGPSVKEAPFVIRSDIGAELARVTYSRVSSDNILMYNNIATASRWTRNVAQSFVVTVDFTTTVPTTSLRIDGVAVAGAQNRPFVAGSAATNLHRVRAEFTGIDSGVMGWDNIEVERMPDQ